MYSHIIIGSKEKFNQFYEWYNNHNIYYDGVK